MTWLFSKTLMKDYGNSPCSQAQGAESWEDTSLDGAQSALWNGTPTQRPSWLPAKTTDACRLSRSGTTFKPLTDERGEAVLTSFLAAFPAKTLAQPEREQESTENEAACGRTWPESFARWDRDLSSWKTPQCSLLAGLDEFSETWPRWGMMRGGECSALTMPALPTNETESGFWPTPRAGNPGSRPNGKGGKVLAEEVAIMQGTRVRGQAIWPTPLASDHRARRASVNWEGNSDLPSVVTAQEELAGNMQPKSGGQLNPTWVEWLMGWPLGWTDCAASATDRFRQWCDSHGKPLTPNL
jgi:hypothetical protein